MRTKAFNIQKYINKLKVAKAPVYVIGQETGLGFKNIKHPSIVEKQDYPKEFQISEFYGKMKDDHLYLNENYKKLLINLKDVDNQYIQTKTIEEKVKLARLGISNWKEFLEKESQNLPEEEFSVREGTLIKLQDIWMRFKKRNKQTITAEEVLPFHNEFTKHYQFDIPLHYKNIAMMLHPHWGFFCKYTKQEFSFDDIIDFYTDEFVSSHYRNIGREILANRISAFNYWKIVDPKLNGFLPFNEFYYLLESMAFNVEELNIKTLNKEFQVALSFLPNELSENEKNNIFRFRLFEYLFIERCAIY
jgi:hypothetical protein